MAALGALAFLALSSTSTSVPPHTIAWIYDSAANETIVYVNPTDQTLSIGNSGLLEIHLQGIVSVEASDFVFVAATAAAAVPASRSILSWPQRRQPTTRPSSRRPPPKLHPTGPSVTARSLQTGTGRFERSASATALTSPATAKPGRIRPAPPMMTRRLLLQQVDRQSKCITVDVTAPTEKNLTLDQKPALDTKIHGANFAAPNNDMFTPSQVNQGQTKDHDGGTAQSHNDRSSIPQRTLTASRATRITGQRQDHKSTVVKETALADDAQGNASPDGGPNSGAPKVHGNAGDDHLSNSGEANKHDTASEHAASDIPSQQPPMRHLARRLPISMRMKTCSISRTRFPDPKSFGCRREYGGGPHRSLDRPLRKSGRAQRSASDFGDSPIA